MKEDKAIEYFTNGYNCAQSVFAVFAIEQGMEEALALKVASGFGSGMGRMQQTCGAVTGAVLAIGLKHGKTLGDEGVEKREKTYQLIQSFDAAFRKKFGTTSCRDLLGCDLTTPAGRQYFVEHQLHEKICQPCVREAVQILESIV